MNATLKNSVVPGIAKQTDATRTMNTTLDKTLTGTSGVGDLNNTKTEQDFRSWTPSSADLVNMVQLGLQTGSLADQIRYYNRLFPVPTVKQLTPENPDNLLAQYGVFSALSTNAALGIADKSFDNVAYILQQINFLYKQLDQLQTLKQSTDFSAVILLKIAALQTELIRLEAQQLKMLGVSQQESNSRRLFVAKFVQDIR